MIPKTGRKLLCGLTTQKWMFFKCLTKNSSCCYRGWQNQLLGLGGQLLFHISVGHQAQVWKYTQLGKCVIGKKSLNA